MSALGNIHCIESSVVMVLPHGFCHCCALLVHEVVERISLMP